MNAPKFDWHGGLRLAFVGMAMVGTLLTSGDAQALSWTITTSPPHPSGAGGVTNSGNLVDASAGTWAYPDGQNWVAACPSSTQFTFASNRCTFTAPSPNPPLNKGNGTQFTAWELVTYTLTPGYCYGLSVIVDQSTGYAGPPATHQIYTKAGSGSWLSLATVSGLPQPKLIWLDGAIDGSVGTFSVLIGRGFGSFNTSVGGPQHRWRDITVSGTPKTGPSC